MSQGDSLHVFHQTKPIFEKIVRELSVDCDRFLDEIANNETELGHGPEAKKTALSSNTLFRILNAYGVYLEEDDKAVLHTCFAYKEHQGKLDIHKLFTYFENFQSAFTVSGKSHC